MQDQDHKEVLGRLLKNVRKSNVTINEAALSRRPQESTYSVEEAKQFIRGMLLSDTSSNFNGPDVERGHNRQSKPS